MNEAGKKKSTSMDKLINVIIAVIIVAFVAVGAYAVYSKISSGITERKIENGEAEATVGYLAKQQDMTVEDYLAQYGLTLGSDIDENTTQSDMLDSMTLEKYAEYSGQNADDIITKAGLSEQVTKDTLWGEVRVLMPVSSYYDEEQLNQIKQIYGIGDEVTLDTKYEDFEKIIEEKQAQMAEATAEPEGETAGGEESNDEAAQESAAE